MTGPDGGEGVEQDVRRIVGSATVRLELLVENAERGRTVDGWLADGGLVWHVRGDLDTPRTAIVVPPPHLGATVAAMVALGTRGAPGLDDVEVPVAALRAQLADQTRTALEGGIVRVWSLHWTGAHPGRISVVDQGPDGGLWTVAAVRGEDVSLHPVTPLDVWTQLCGLPAVARGEVSSG